MFGRDPGRTVPINDTPEGSLNEPKKYTGSRDEGSLPPRTEKIPPGLAPGDIIFGRSSRHTSSAFLLLFVFLPSFSPPSLSPSFTDTTLKARLHRAVRILGSSASGGDVHQPGSKLAERGSH